jgi:hypothetical protein
MKAGRAKKAPKVPQHGDLENASRGRNRELSETEVHQGNSHGRSRAETDTTQTENPSDNALADRGNRTEDSTEEGSNAHAEFIGQLQASDVRHSTFGHKEDDFED